ncbi:uncharacterized protein LOC105234653 isoform X1 [Ailuropoda melanoleuca]|uniref:uncharacterized protein LOC105234653 isoform X1 n=1 Tax=Ailuropoda melanoleuca TaxID=9646 RepID=UPI0014950450|nr:uncharacterized protein LOC105234653 isoform X1 [Ailuropoda melanoleuca]
MQTWQLSDYTFPLRPGPQSLLAVDTPCLGWQGVLASVSSQVQWPRQAHRRPTGLAFPSLDAWPLSRFAGKVWSLVGMLRTSDHEDGGPECVRIDDDSLILHSLEKLNKMSENSLPSFSSKLRSGTLSPPGQVWWPHQAHRRPAGLGLPVIGCAEVGGVPEKCGPGWARCGRWITKTMRWPRQDRRRPARLALPVLGRVEVGQARKKCGPRWHAANLGS